MARKGKRLEARFEGFHEACAKLPAGLVRVAEGATEEQIGAAEKALGRRLPGDFAGFLRSSNGADLFHESLVIYGVGEGGGRDLVAANRSPRPVLLGADDLIIAEDGAGDRYALVEGAEGGEPAVVHVRVASDERWLAGSTFSRWLESFMAREHLLYDADGEFRLEAFEDDGDELTAAFALRQAERAVRKDPRSAENQHDLGVAHRRLGRLDRAREAFQQAARLDHQNPWPFFDLGRTELALERPAQAILPFRRAAAVAPAGERARFFAWAARAAREAESNDEADQARRDAEAADPDILTVLRRASAAAEDERAADEARALVEALEPPKRRLPILSADGRSGGRATRGPKPTR